MPKPIVLKIILAGDGGTGKTTLLHRYISSKFIENLKMTIGVEFFLQELIMNDKNVVLQIWDFGGQDRFRFLLEKYVLGAKGALLMFDLTRPMTLESIEDWVRILRKYDSNLPIIFIGSKLDLMDKSMIDEEYIDDLREQFKLSDYIKVSSKTGENVELAFKKLTEKIIYRLGI